MEIGNVENNKIKQSIDPYAFMYKEYGYDDRRLDTQGL